MTSGSRWTAPLIHGRSAYTVLGFTGYIVAALLLGVIGTLHGISLAERIVIQLVPPLSLLVTW